MKSRDIKNQNALPCLLFVLLIFFTCALYAHYRTFDIAPINSTTFAFSYKYGFISRGLIGSVFSLISSIIPDLYSPGGVIKFSLWSAVLTYAVCLTFIGISMKKTESSLRSYEVPLSIFMLWFLVPTYISVCNLGRLDLYCLLFSLIAAILIIEKKFLFLCIPLSALGVMAHQGCVFMYSNIILILLFFLAMQEDGKKRRNLIILDASCFVIVSVLFLWFELFSHGNGNLYYDSIIKDAISLNYGGNIHEGVVKKEILGISLADTELQHRPVLLKQLLVFVVMMTPYIFLLARYFTHMIKTASSIPGKLAQISLAAGPLTLIPEIILKIDYGRWVICFIVYYVVVIIAASTINPDNAKALKEKLIPKNKIALFILMIYPAVFQPVLDTNVSALTRYIARILFGFTA